MGEASSDLFPIKSAEFLADPYPFYAQLRQQAPFYDTALGFTAVARYADVHRLLTSPHVMKVTDLPQWLDATRAPAVARLCPGKWAINRAMITCASGAR